MNFLAHAFLAAPDPALMAGGVLGDWVKGPLANAALPPAFARGVALHRAIDSFADGHPAFRRSRARVDPARRRWGGILVDMYYDHLLAAHWADYEQAPLSEFVDLVHAALLRHMAALPAAMPAARLMVNEAWLLSYGSEDGLAAILQRMSQRARQPNPLAEGLADLRHARAGLASDCAEFLGDAKVFAAAWVTANA